LHAAQAPALHEWSETHAGIGQALSVAWAEMKLVTGLLGAFRKGCWVSGKTALQAFADVPLMFC